MKFKLNRQSATIVLVLTTVIWGFAFIAQKNAMDIMGPLTFIGARYLLGGIVLIPLAIWEYRRANRTMTRRHWWLIIGISLNFFIGSYLQQAGLIETTATNGGFLTGFYVFFVPIILLVVFRTKPHPIVWVCAPLALLGLYLLNGATLDKINDGDILIIISAVFWALHVLLVGFTARETGLPIVLSCVSFLIAGTMGEAGAFMFEAPSLAQLQTGWIEIAYTGILSTALAFTLQAIGQLYIPPANTAIILSGEALYAAIGGAWLLGERLPTIGYAGAALIFSAIVIVEVLPYFFGPKPEPS